MVVSPLDEEGKVDDPETELEDEADEEAEEEEHDAVAQDEVTPAEGHAVVPAEPAPGPPKEAKAVVVAKPSESALVLSEAHGEDGRLLRMFVERWEHKKADARVRATETWLIRGNFYDEMLEEFVEKYQLPLVATDDQETELERESLALALSGVFTGRSPSAQLQCKLEKAGGDTYVLRDTLLQAVRQLSTPRRFLGKACADAMTDEAKASLKLREGRQTRDIIMACLRGIYASDAGSEILQICVDAVSRSINKFEARASDDVSQAMGGVQWSQLKDLVSEIDDKLGIERGVPKAIKFNHSAPEGRGTSRALERCLADLGGVATLTEVFEWIESHQDALEQFKGVRLNQKESKAKRKAGGAEPIWKSTVRNALAREFQRGGRRGRSVLWQVKGAAPVLEEAADPRAEAEDAAIEDESADRPTDRELPALQDLQALVEAESPPAKKQRQGETELGVVPEFA